MTATSNQTQQIPLLLASASPRRQELLAQVGVPFEVLAANIDEAQLQTSDPIEMASTLARLKAESVYGRRSGAPVLAADTVVGRRDLSSWQLFGKPSSREDAQRMLECLQGSEHTVVTAFCLILSSGEIAHEQAVSSLVRFRPMTRAEILDYVATGEGDDKAGAYAVQGLGAAFIESISGSYTNIVGLPLCEVLLALKAQGLWSSQELVE